MTLGGFLRDRAGFLAVHLLGAVLTAAYLLLSGSCTLAQAEALLAGWGLLLLGGTAWSYQSRKRYFQRLESTLEGLEQKYLLSEVTGRPYRAEDRAHYDILRSCGRSMLEEITRVRRERSEYKEYIEGWVHEVKTPIAAMKLTCENHRADTSRRILAELEKTENYVEQVLFYARSEQVEKDYLIRELPLQIPVSGALIRNKQLFIQSGAGVTVEGLDCQVYSDGKWVEFILNQILINAVKYRREKPQIRISAIEEGGGVTLEVWDNGAGIAPEDLPRIFDKGFTGRNGREEEKSTGIGLYLCRRLCLKLGLTIRAESVPESYTRILIFFPKGTFVKV